MQNSFFARNILIQPGPLTVSPSLRSISTPSFRVVDYGRAECWKYFHLQECPGKRQDGDIGEIIHQLAVSGWGEMLAREKDLAKDTLYGRPDCHGLRPYKKYH